MLRTIVISCLAMLTAIIVTNIYTYYMAYTIGMYEGAAIQKQRTLIELRGVIDSNKELIKIVDMLEVMERRL